MLPRQVPAVEPFVERIDPALNSLSAGAYRFGYRLERTKEVLSTVDIPADIVERALTAGLTLSARMNSAGDVSPTLVDSDMAIASNIIWASESIERLVADAVDADNVRLEETGTDELKTLLARLERSVLLVERAIAQVGTPND